jgi:hypothetical protein
MWVLTCASRNGNMFLDIRGIIWPLTYTNVKEVVPLANESAVSFHILIIQTVKILLECVTLQHY